MSTKLDSERTKIDGNSVSADDDDESEVHPEQEPENTSGSGQSKVEVSHRSRMKKIKEAKSYESFHGMDMSKRIDLTGIATDDLQRMSLTSLERLAASGATERGERIKKMPEDVYSFIAFSGKMTSLTFGFMVVDFQIFFLVILIMGVRNTDDDSGIICFPTDVKPDVRVAQYLSLLFYVMFPGSSIQDIISGIENFPVGKGVDTGAMMLAFFMKILLGMAAAIATFFLVMTSTTALDVVLNFAAVNFISEMDDDVFSLARKGTFGRYMLCEAIKIQKAELCEYKNLGSLIPESVQTSWIVQGVVFVTFIVIGTFFFQFQHDPCLSDD